MEKAYLLITLLLISFSRLVSAQTEGLLQGIVTTENGVAVGFANVAVVEAASSKVVTGAIADLDGNFQIKTPKAGTYKLKVNGLGYLELLTPAFEVQHTGFSKDFGQLQLKQDVKTLREVEVQALRPTITTQADKMVVSVENTAIAAGNTAYDVLIKSPGVWVDQDGNIQLNGKGGVQVMLNGRRSYLSGKELQNLLQNMSAENLKDLEIITNPSARYDAEGASGIININLKKGKDAGLNGSVYGGYQYNSLSSFTSGAEVSHKNGNWNSFGTVNLNKRQTYRNMEMARVFAKESVTRSVFDQIGYEEQTRLAPSLRLGTDYDFDAKHSIGGVANLNLNQIDMVFNTTSTLQRAQSQYIDADNTSKQKYANSTFNLHYVGKLDTTGTQLSADLDYVRISNDDKASFLNTFAANAFASPDSLQLYRNENPARYHIYAAKVDYSKRLSKATSLELGAKASHVTSDNELRFFEVNDEVETQDSKRSNHFIYKENIYAAYASLSAAFGNTWNLQAGLRAEQTVSLGESLTKHEKNDRNYLNLFPTLFVQQRVSEDYQIGYKYSRRISRPYYQHLNPFLFYLDPYTFAQGNPQLKPEYINSVEMTHTYKQRYNLVLEYSVTKDFIGELPELDAETSTTVFQQRNIRNLKSATATLIAPIKISDKWEISNNITGMYQQYTTLIQNNIVVKDQFTAIANTNHTLLLPHGFRLEASANYQGALVYGLYNLDPQAWLDAGIKRNFLDDKLSISLNASDIFKSRSLLLDSEVNGNSNKIKQYQGHQGVRLNLTYRFSKGTKFEGKKRDTSLEELNRTGG